MEKDMYDLGCNSRLEEFTGLIKKIKKIKNEGV
jgi:hypothetical protein